MVDADILTFLILGALAGGFVNGLAGFGTALFALGFWLQVMPPVQAVAITVLVAALTGLQGAWLVRGQILAQPRRLMRFVLPSLVGIPLGIWALRLADPTVLRLTIAGFLILYGGFFLLRRSLPKFDRRTPVADAGIGLAGGFLGGFAGLSGALPAMWCALRPWGKSETRAVLQPYNIVVLTVSTAILATRGAYSSQVLLMLAYAVPIALLGAQIGLFTFKRLSDGIFRWVLIVLMFASGISLLAREMLFQQY